MAWILRSKPEFTESNSPHGKVARLEWVRIPQSPTRAVLLFCLLKTTELYSAFYLFTYQSLVREMEGCSRVEKSKTSNKAI